MKAVVVRRLGGAAVLEVERVAIPELREGEALIRVRACGVCFHDVVARNGTMRRGVSTPFIPGHEVAGEIVEIAPGVSQVKVGDRVASTLRRSVCGHCRYCRSGREASCPDREPIGDSGLNGGYAEYVCISEDSLARIPEGVSMEAAAIAGCAIGTQFNAVRDVANVALGERVLVTGASGGLGIHGVQLAKLAGAQVLALTTSPGKASSIREAGADHVVVAERNGDLASAISEITAGGGVDVVIDNVGTPLFHATRRCLAESGRWVLVGQVTGDFVEFNPAQLFFRGISILTAKSASREQLREVLALVASGSIRPVISRCGDLGDACSLHRDIEHGVHVGREVITP